MLVLRQHAGFQMMSPGFNNVISVWQISLKLLDIVKYLWCCNTRWEIHPLFICSSPHHHAWPLPFYLLYGGVSSGGGGGQLLPLFYRRQYLTPGVLKMQHLCCICAQFPKRKIFPWGVGIWVMVGVQGKVESANSGLSCCCMLCL